MNNNQKESKLKSKNNTKTEVEKWIEKSKEWLERNPRDDEVTDRKLQDGEMYFDDLVTNVYKYGEYEFGNRIFYMDGNILKDRPINRN